MFKKILDYIKESFPVRMLTKLIKNPILIVAIVLLTLLAKDQVVEWYDEYMVLYEEANNKIAEEENSGGLVFTKIDHNLYTLTGTVKAKDCEKERSVDAPGSVRFVSFLYLASRPVFTHLRPTRHKPCPSRRYSGTDHDVIFLRRTT